jgi:hypothetical protein
MNRQGMKNLNKKERRKFFDQRKSKNQTETNILQKTSFPVFDLPSSIILRNISTKITFIICKSSEE